MVCKARNWSYVQETYVVGPRAKKKELGDYAPAHYDVRGRAPRQVAPDHESFCVFCIKIYSERLVRRAGVRASVKQVTVLLSHYLQFPCLTDTFHFTRFTQDSWRTNGVIRFSQGLILLPGDRNYFSAICCLKPLQSLIGHCAATGEGQLRRTLIPSAVFIVKTILWKPAFYWKRRPFHSLILRTVCCNCLWNSGPAAADWISLNERVDSHSAFASRGPRLLMSLAYIQNRGSSIIMQGTRKTAKTQNVDVFTIYINHFLWYIYYINIVKIKFLVAERVYHK